jgi:hypothetical protein
LWNMETDREEKEWERDRLSAYVRVCAGWGGVERHVVSLSERVGDKKNQ